MSTGRLQKVAYGLAAAPLLCLSALAYAGDITVHEAYTQMGFATAAAKACPKVKISPDALKDLAASLNAKDQAEFFGSSFIDFYAEVASKKFALAGDRACDIVFDYMKKSKFKLLEPAN
jgi:hypothetical protein